MTALRLALKLWLLRLAHSIGGASRPAVYSGEAGQPPPVAEAELRETIARLRESVHQLRLITDTAPVAIARLDTEARYTFVNRNLAERQGLASEQIIGRRIPEVTNPKAFAIIEPYFRECLAGKAVEFEIEVPDRTGQSRFMQARFEPEWSGGKVIGLVSASTEVTRIKRTEAALRDSEAAFRAMFEVSSVGKVEFDPGTGRFLRANSAMCKLLGYSEPELLALTIFDVTHPDEREGDREPLQRLAAGKSTVFDVEKRYIRKDGSAVWSRTTVNVVRDDAGRALRNTAVILDITDRKRREEKERLLMREVSHRAKNMLSVVHSIAQQTANHDSKDFIERFSARIQALSANQDLLVRNEWQGVDVEDLVRAQLSHFAALIGSRIATQGPRLRLNAASAQAIGLALHELATNAGKYGALSADTGHVDVTWGIDSGTFKMAWTERNGPTVSVPQMRGFGTIVMEAMAERSVGGAVDLDYPPSGVTWRLTCPAANVQDSSEASRDA